MSEAKTPLTSSELLSSEAVCLVIKATLKPVGDTDRFQPAGFPEVGHVIYDAPRSNRTKEKVCIVDSPASMANHLETVCAAATGSLDLHDDLTNLPFVLCETDDRDAIADPSANAKKKKGDIKQTGIGVCSTLTEGHRLASDYFLDSVMNPTWVDAAKKMAKAKDGTEKEETVAAHWGGTIFREQLRKDFKIVEVKKDKTYFIPPEKWWDIFNTVFKYDPNSLVHGVMFAKEQIKISRLLTAHLEAFGAAPA
jgi:CRISPR-associated protein Csb1